MRFAVIIGLVLSLLLLGENALQSWQEIELPKMPEVSQKKTGSVASEQQNVAVNPQVPVVMPDLNTGYLFNVQRSRTEQDEQEATSAASVDEQGSQVDMDTLVYSGSIIINKLHKGLVSFSLKEENKNVVSPQRRGPYMARRPKPKEVMQKATVVEGEDFYGFKVASVQPDRILFSKNGTSIEKLLYDPNKERPKAGAPKSSSARPAPANVNPAKGGAVAVPHAGPAGIVGRPRENNVSRGVITTPHSTTTVPGVRNPRLGNTFRRPQVIQRRRLPAQTR